MTTVPSTNIIASQILHHTTAFLTEVLSQSELRHRLFTACRRRPPLSSKLTANDKLLNLASESLEKAIYAKIPAVKSSSLRLAERLLLPCAETSFSSFLLSLVYTLSNQPTSASVSLLNVFSLDPSLARSDIALVLFEELFLIHLLPVLQWFNEQRSKILSSLSMNMGYDSDENSISDMSVVVPCTKLLSKMSGDQALELKELESSYEEIIDENCRVLARYFKEVLENDGANRLINPPSVFLKEIVRTVESPGHENKKTNDTEEQLGFMNGRYNPIWAGGETSFESRSFGGSSKSRSLQPCYPQRVSPKTIKNKNSGTSKASTTQNSDSEQEFYSDNNLLDSSSYSSSDSEAETLEKNRKMALFEPGQRQEQKQKQPVVGDSSRASPTHLMADIDNPPGGGKSTPPKDFVCPITSHLFDDPVTLETGQTYERKAIQEWLERGNSTCPITRQKLHSTQLPKTNYVLKRLIASWREQHPGSGNIQSNNQRRKKEPSFASTVLPSNSPGSVISQAAMDGTISELRHAITSLCTSENLGESERAVLRMERFWQEANMELEIQSMLSKPPVINGFVEILFNSVDHMVLNATVFLLTELGSRDKGVIHTLTRVDSDVDCIVTLFKKGLLEAVVLIHLLRPSTMGLLEMDMVESLLTVIKKKEEDAFKMCLKPKTAAVHLLGQILGSSEEGIVSSIANAIVSTKVVENIVGSLEAETAEERIAAVGILLKCIQKEGKCRNTIANKAQLVPILECFTTASDGERFEILQFLSELVKLNRRTVNEQILHIIKDEGSFSTMHTLLNYLQIAPQDQCPTVAGLLLQLDLLAEPRKMSIYREEAIEALIASLKNSELPAAQITAAEMIVSLQGRFTASGKSLTRAFLLKRAGLDKTYRNLMRMEQLGNLSGEIEEALEEEKAAEDWERKMAFALVSHEFGLLFEALAEGLKSKCAELCSACFVSATWLTHMVSALPDTGIRAAARICLLKRFVTIFKSAKDTEDKVLSLLALNSFIKDPEGLRDLTSYMKDIKKDLRELKRSSSLAFEILKILSDGQDSSAGLWNHKELVQVDSSENGEVLSIACFKNKIFSGHSDGTIKVWTGRGSILHLIQEIREHGKAVTSLTVLESEERLFSGSLDKTSRVWSIGNESVHCVEVHDLKDQVHDLVVANRFSCFITQGAGVKVRSWNGKSKVFNPSKYVKCLSLSHGKLYCGCHDSSIQEIDLATETHVTIQNGSRKLLAKANPIHALQVHDGLIYSASSAMDGAAVKIWNASNYGLIGSVPTTLEVRAMTISSDLIYLGCKSGTVEIWDRKKQSKIETLQTGTNGKVTCMALDEIEEVLVIGTSDGRIQAWCLS